MFPLLFPFGCLYLSCYARSCAFPGLITGMEPIPSSSLSQPSPAILAIPLRVSWGGSDKVQEQGIPKGDYILKHKKSMESIKRPKSVAIFIQQQ